MPGPGAEDIGFSPTEGVFSVVSREGDFADPAVYHVTPSAVVTPFSDPIVLANNLTTGTRYMADGDLVLAAFFADWLYRVDSVTGALPLSERISFDDAIDGPNQVVPDVMGNIWITSSDNSAIVVIDPSDGSATTVISGVAEVGFANGLVVDWDRMQFYWTDYDAGRVRRQDFNAQLGAVGPPQTIGDVGGFPDGMTMDACGYLYIVDQNNAVPPSRLQRIALDPLGDPIGDPEVLVSNFDTAGLANAQFAQGTGWEDFSTTLFITGFEGVIYTVDVQVQGAPSAIIPR